jgi:hypothetical protein
MSPSNKRKGREGKEKRTKTNYHQVKGDEAGGEGGNKQRALGFQSFDNAFEERLLAPIRGLETPEQMGFCEELVPPKGECSLYLG